MMLRSSSTPVLGSLLQPFSDCPNNNSHHQSELHKHTKISCSCSGNGGGSQDFKKSLIHPSPSLADIKGGGGGGGFRRAQSDGNLEGLGDTCLYSVDEFNIPKRASRRTSLEAIPSFSANNLWTSFEDDDDDYEGVDEDEEEIGGGFDYNPMRAENTVFEKVARNAIGYGSEGLGSQSEGKMYLASGIGVSGVDFTGRGGGGGGGRGSYRPVAFDKEGGGGVSMEEYYKRMLEENPGDPLFLRNYAEFLYKIKRDVGAAEEYYSRAILADQEDGETLSQYAILIWEVHHDRDRAANYFERALEASSQSSHIHAAYANFLWDEEEEEEEEEENAGAGSQPFLHQGVMASATA